MLAPRAPGVLARPGRQQLRVEAKGFGFSKVVGKPKDLLRGREPLRPHTLSPPREVPPHIPLPPYAKTGKLPRLEMRPEVHDAAGIERMRASCKLAAQVLRRAGEMVAPGVTTDAIDAAVHEMIVGAGAYPSPLNYGKFPKSVCTSVNECLCHGIPDSRPLQEGDIINIDVTVYLDGYHGDTSAMFYVGSPAPVAKRLCEATREALDAAIKEGGGGRFGGAAWICGPDVPLTAIGDTIVEVAKKAGFKVSPDFIGHGVGRVFHASPSVMHVKNAEPGRMQVNSTFTIEPILTEGSPRMVEWKDKWTAVTADGGLAAQAEHTVLITSSGAEVLTLP
ncbi:methionine aminopeptidase [Raphidocelis subcapitata]|uniref:Methionine aminopeptidase n=1 Tax=Raphidocelis subcapitata TaxID=307507 RepID=A0A2V0NW38_9CHLO|nr:methionine aminopeptidase [Raphidocelis subcapitata]|eukprot:GBF89157.1 methionine aminopeptidase [Raphidocelis subcapitata]